MKACYHSPNHFPYFHYSLRCSSNRYLLLKPFSEWQLIAGWHIAMSLVKPYRNGYRTNTENKTLEKTLAISWQVIQPYFLSLSVPDSLLLGSLQRQIRTHRIWIMNSLQGISVPFTWGVGDEEEMFDPKTTLCLIIHETLSSTISHFSLLYFCYLTDGVKKKQKNKTQTRWSPKDAL